jgi:uncharacterized membrane protein
MTISSDVPYQLCVAKEVSDDGRVVVCEIKDQAYLWTAATGKRKVADLLHERGFATEFPVITVQALSADGHTIAGTLSDYSKSYQLFVYRMP